MASVSKTNNKADVYHVQVLDRAFRILDILAETGSGIGLTDIADRLELHKSTAIGSLWCWNLTDLSKETRLVVDTTLALG